VRHFDAAYREQVTLADGGEVELRLVRPEDKELFTRGLDRLSPQSRYLRFFSPKLRFTPAELRYLTELDHETHLAIGAQRIGADGKHEGLGVARFVRLPDDPSIAEPAVAVVDDMQGKGLGRILLSRLVAAARERGVRTFRSEVLAENVAMRQLLEDLAPGRVREHDGGTSLVLEMQLPEVPPGAPPHAELTGVLPRLLALAAEGLVRVAHVLRRIEPDEPRQD
jgi:GNAT superfamily N-acetyltransferase